MISIPLTHHDTAIEAFIANGNNDVFANTFKNFAPGKYEAVFVCAFRVSVTVDLDDLRKGNLLYSVRLASGFRFVAFDVMA
jgi:hypothetical protein